MIYEYDIERFHVKWINRLSQYGYVTMDLIIVDTQNEYTDRRIQKSIRADLETQVLLDSLAATETNRILSESTEGE
jgi:hypothetical protein